MENDLRLETQQNRAIFLSYARSDGRTFASDLHELLESENMNYRVWQDVFDMYGGENWWLQIEDNIKAADAVILIVTQSALESEIVRREWTTARRFGTQILPVTNETKIFENAPRWMKQIDVFVLTPGHPDYSKTYKRFMHQLKEPPDRRQVPFMGLPLLPQFVRREHMHQRLVNHFLDGSRANPCFSTTMLYGAPGFGKTTLAQDVCHNPEIIEVFTGGILWATLGEQGQGMLPGLNAMVGALSHEPISFNTPEEASARLNQLLENRDCLMILDDVWSSAHIKPFLGSVHCARLITLRDPQNCLLPGEIILEHLEEMSNAEATQMLLNFLPSGALTDYAFEDVKKALEALAERLGEWPLLLNIFGGTLRSEISELNHSFNDALNWLQEGLNAIGLSAFDHNQAEDRNEALTKSMEVSLQRYTEAQKQRLFELSIFRPHEAIRQNIVFQLWKATSDMNDFEAKRLLRGFGGTFFQFSFEREFGSDVLRFHDALREYLEGQVSSDRKLELHRLFLQSYNKDGRTWISIEDDKYIRDHLAYHLNASGAIADLHALFQDQQWLNLRFIQRGHTYDGYLDDLVFAKEAVASSTLSEIKAGDQPQSIVLNIHYRLIITSINSISDRYIPELLVQAFERNLWAADRLISIAIRIPEVNRRIEMFSRILACPSLIEPHRSKVERQAIIAVKEWGDLPVYSLTTLCCFLSNAAKDVVLQKALEVAINYPVKRKTESEAEKALGRYDYYLEDKETAHALASVAKHLTGEKLENIIKNGLNYVSNIENPKEKVYAISAWLSQLDNSRKNEMLGEALKEANNIENQQEKIFAFAAIAKGLKATEKADVLDTAWNLSVDIVDEPWRAFCLSRVVPQLKGEKRKQGIELGLRTLESDRGWQLILACKPTFDSSEWTEVLAAIQNITDYSGRVEMLVELGAPLSQQEMEFAFNKVLNTDIRWGTRYRDEQLIKLAPRLSTDLLLRALELVFIIDPSESDLLDKLANRFLGKKDSEDPGEEWIDPFENYHALPIKGGYKPLWEYGDVHSLISASEERETLLEAELEHIRHIDEEIQPYALRSLIPKLNSKQLEKAWNIARQISDGWLRSQPLLALAYRFEGEQRDHTLQESVAAVFEEGPANGDRRAAIIENMVAILPMQLIKVALSNVMSFTEWSRIRALKALCRHIKGELIHPALEAIRNLSNDSSKRELIEMLANNLTDDWISEALEVTEGIINEDQRTAALEAVTTKAQNNVSYKLLLKAQEKLMSAINRARVLEKLLSISENEKELLLSIRFEILEHLHHGLIPTRAEVLEILSLDNLFREPIFDKTTLLRITATSFRICKDWRWS